MKSERVLSLDISTKTGYTLGISSQDGIKLVDYGTIPQIHEPAGNYPSNYVMWAYNCFEKILEIVVKSKPDVLVIEETSKGSKSGMSQKILEFLHFLVAKYITDNNIKCVYIMTEQWRREIGCKMTDAEKLKNKEVRTYKKKKKTKIAYDINGKRIGLVSRKHVNIRRVSEIFKDQLKAALRPKDEDQADGLGLLACYHMRRFKVDDVKEVNLEDILENKV